ncbi:ABC transporter ATP-binding protein [Desulfosporosinus fructosivorans]|uniref:ABC-type quaternary amine transporter n=2 Tax=Desulfosporosinus fructosivorans TaxID=2018669 RepID=A0A4Z0RAI8_9FIRM|nr:ABC transporter ATP-binding protein [Desulfosporosinus fructosivorans]
MDNLSLSNLHVSLGGNKILKGINFKVKKGEIVSLLGPSGCGKSTLLKTIAGLIEPSEGEVYIGGQQVNRLAPEERGTVIVFQDLRLFPHMDVGQNIGFGLKMKGVHKEIIRKNVINIMEKVGLDGYEKFKVFELSGGQQQRVALARALAAEPQVLLLDEPFSSLDENLRQKMRELVIKLHRELNLTTILVTHDQEEALVMSDRIAIMFKGQILQYDTPKSVYENPATPEVANYFGEMNSIEGFVENGFFQSFCDSSIGGCKTSLEDGSYSLMLKPSHIKLVKEPGAWIIKAISYLGDKYNIRITDNVLDLVVVTASNIDIHVGESVNINVDYPKGILYKKELG